MSFLTDGKITPIIVLVTFHHKFYSSVATLILSYTIKKTTQEGGFFGF